MQQNFALAYEPTWPVGNQDLDPDAVLTATSGFTSLPENDAIYAFHYYSPPCSTDLDSYLDERLSDAARLNSVPFASEFNLFASNEEEEMKMVTTFNTFENKKISFTGWQYKSFAGSLPNGTCTGCGNRYVTIGTSSPNTDAPPTHTQGTNSRRRSLPSSPRYYDDWPAKRAAPSQTPTCTCTHGAHTRRIPRQFSLPNHR